MTQYRVIFDDTTAEALGRLTEAEIGYLFVDVAGDLRLNPHGPGMLMHADPPRSFYALDIGTRIRIGYWVDDEKHLITVQDVVTGTFPQ